MENELSEAYKQFVDAAQQVFRSSEHSRNPFESTYLPRCLVVYRSLVEKLQETGGRIVQAENHEKHKFRH